MSAITSCAPCVFGAVSTSLLSFPGAIGTVQVSIVPVVTVGSNGTVITSLSTSTISPATSPGAVSPTTTVTFTDASQITWSTLGTVLTYPTTYVDYLAFQGAGATAGSCAQTLTPTSLTLSAGAPAASQVYPLDRTNALPAGLISYLNGAGFPAQLAGNQLQTCAALPGALPVTGTISSVTIPTTSVTTATSTGVTIIPPPSTFTTTGTSTFVGSATIAATDAVALSTNLLFNTVTGNALVVSGSVTSSLTAPLAVTLPGGSTTIIGKGTTSAVDITKVLSSISSSVSNRPSSGSATATVKAPSSASSASLIAYTGAADANSPALLKNGLGVLAGAAAVLYL